MLDSFKSGNTLKDTFEDISPDLFKLVKGLLEFNPYFRLSAEEALKSPVFDKIRVPKYEKPSPIKIN